MVRIGLSVEGTTEERFVKTVLVPHFFQRNVAIVPISMRGNVSQDRVANEVRKLAYSFDYVSTFYDFYGFKRRPAGINSGAALAESIAESVPANIRARFIPYIQMYEFEALLFSCPRSMAAGLNAPDREQWCSQILIQFQNNPELINDSPHTAPSKRLECQQRVKTDPLLS